MAQGPIISYDAKLLKPGVDLTLTGVGTPNLTATYGDYGGVGEPMSLKASCTVSINYTDINWIVNNDNSITVTGKINGGILRRVATGTSSINTQSIQAWFNNVRTFHIERIETDSSGTYDLNIPDTFSVTIPPLATNDHSAAIHFLSMNDQGDPSQGRIGDEFALGILITNPNPPDYRPGAVLSEGKWLSHNRSGGEAHILKADGKWKEMRTADGHSTNNNPPSIRIGNKWTDQKKIGKE